MAINLNNIDPRCLQNEVLGCTYEEASNFNPNATFEDGSCTFNLPNPAYEFMAFGTHYQQCTNFNALVSPNTFRKASFFLFFQPRQTPNVQFEVGDLVVVRTFAYQDFMSNTGAIKLGCLTTGTQYRTRPLAVGNLNRLPQGVTNVFAIPWTPTQPEFRRLHLVEASELDSDLDFNGSPYRTLPLEISVIRKNPNRVYTGIINVKLHTYNDSIDYSQQIYTI